MSDYVPKCKNTLPIIFDDHMPVNNLLPKIVNRVNDITADTRNLYSETETAQGDIEDLQEAIAPAYSATSTYAVGDYVLYNNVLYRCTTAIAAAEAWTAAHWTAVNVGSELTDYKEDINEFSEGVHSDLLYGKPITDKWFINNNTGVGETNAGFYSYENVDIPNGIVRLYPYNNFDGTGYQYIRSICFYDSNGTFLSGISGNTSTVNRGIPVPSNAKKISCSLNKVASGDGKHYLSTVPGGDAVTYPLKDNVSIKSSQIIYNKPLSDNVRMPCINFQFDDGVAKDADIVNIFNTYGFKCGFAILSNINQSEVARYLGYQNSGYEILCHADSGTGMNDATVSLDTIETRLKTSKETLESYEYKIRGFVTPNSTMADKFKPLLRKYYQWAETVYLGSYTGTGLRKPYMKPVDDAFNGWRVSLQTTTLANQKAAVDAAIENYGIITFYGHAVSLDTTDNLTTANLNDLLTYIQAKVQAGKCIVGTPSEVKNNYFSVRNDDVSNGWVSVSATEALLDARFNVNFWEMEYNEKLGLFWFNVRVNPTEAVSGQLMLFTSPVKISDGALIQSETGRNCLVYSDKLLIQGSNTWNQGTNYRFSAMLKIKSVV